jgi:hypothetical protein
MTPEEKKAVDDVCDAVESVIVDAIEKTGRELFYMLSIIENGKPSGGMITNVSPSHVIEFSNVAHEQLKIAIKGYAERQ